MLDLDGVIWLSGEILPGVANLLEYISCNHLRYCFLTNNSAANCSKVAERVSSSGFQVEANTVYTSASATADYLHHNCNDANVLLLGSNNLYETLATENIKVTKLFPEVDPDILEYDGFTHVIIGIDWTANYAMLKACCYAVQAGCQLIGTNSDFSYPFLGGKNGPGAGSLLSIVAGVTKVQPFIIGKPEKYLYEYTCTHLNANPEQTLIIGDRLDTDIELANRVGAPSILIETGIDKADDIVPGRTAIPDLIFPDLPALLEWLKARSNVY